MNKDEKLCKIFSRGGGGGGGGGGGLGFRVGTVVVG